MLFGLFGEKTDGKITYRWGIDSIDATGRFSHLQQSLLLAPGPAKRSCLNMLGKAQKNSSENEFPQWPGNEMSPIFGEMDT